MKIACLIVTYTSAKQTKRLVDKLNNGDFDFYIHVDKKLSMDTHKILFNMPNVFFIKDRIDIKWASYTSVKATFNGLKQIEASGIQYDFVNLMSGQDYPIKSAKYISSFLSKHKGKQFIHYKDFDEWTGAQGRIDKYHFADMHFKGKYYIQQFVNLFIDKRKPPENIKPYGYSTFWTLTLDCALYIVEYVESHHDVQTYFKYTFGSDEFIYQTVIMNSIYKDDVINNNYRYVDWTNGGFRPKFLATEDYDKLIASDCLFGRKFNIDIDEHILDLIDSENAKQDS
ncbi:MAG: beta-1,6-N-acetylglucosaminyltransferase [Mucilaginibacter sp.]|uniref:beta-1,6-N-acetylglucosaminyltransferase n=1 Tax=Mucilaginibacter sp. TaxID=1882438 RepID=UPI00326773D0